MNVSKLAVILRGHRRTWDYTKKSIIDFFKSKANQVDFYVVWWQTGSITLESIHRDFENCNLKAAILVEEVEKYGDPFYGPAYLSNKVANNIFEEEVISSKKYDLIVDTRADVLHYSYPECNIKWNCPSWSLGFVRIETDNTGGIRGLDDHCFVGTSETLCLWNQRIFMDMSLDQKLALQKGHHSLYNTFVENYRLHKFEIPWFRSFIVRPSICNFNRNNVLSIKEIMLSEDQWQNSKIAQRLEIVDRSKIPRSEYNSALGVGPLKYITE